MDPANQSPNVEFLWRRLMEECPVWTPVLPVVFALVVVTLVALFRKQRDWAGYLWSVGIVGALACVYLPLALMLRPVLSWLVVLVPVVGLALFYTGAMYFADARSIHPAWAAFLGFLRCCVYAILALVFLLPGLQFYDDTVTYPKSLMLFDVSGSMQRRDDVPEVGQDPAKLPTRQDKVIRFLMTGSGDQGAFLEQVLGKTDVTAYRFGSTMDESQVHNLKQGRTLTLDDCKRWLKPNPKDIQRPEGLSDEKWNEERLKRQDQIESLLSGTNYAGSALQMLKLENNAYLQAVIITGDGQSNLGSEEALKEFLARVNTPKRIVPVITIGVGQFIQPAEIRIDDLQLPEVTRPDDKFPVRVPVVGSGLAGEEFKVTLDIARVKDASGVPVKGEKTYTLGPRTGTFKGAGDNPQDIVEFEIDVQDLKSLKATDDKNGELEGTWQVVARVPRNPRESSFANPEHVTEPVDILVQKKKLRVLLFAGGPTHEYQFVRTLFFREVLEKRVDMSVYLQGSKEENVDQDVEKDRLLDQFPDRLGEDDGKHLSLNDYDVIIAFDPDWTLLSPAQLGLLKNWVDNHSGGIIFVAGPVHSYHLARPGGRDLSALLSIFPVVLQDSRLHGLGLPNAGLGHDTSRPYVLHFTEAAKEFDFLKIDETGDGPTAGWNHFFYGRGATVEPGKDIRPRHGFYNYYPVDRLKPDSAVVARFAGPKESYINEGKDEQPYIVSMRFGTGKTVYVGSGELWRLRTIPGFHERFWIKLARYVSAGATQQKKYGRIVLGRSAPAGNIIFEAQIKAPNLLPLPADARPAIYVKRIDKDAVDGKDNKPVPYDLRPKPTDNEWQGWFQGNVRLRDPGEYEFRIPITGTSESLTHRLIVRKPNPEDDNIRTNFANLYTMSSEASPVLARLAPEDRKAVEQALQNSGMGGGRLFFTLQNAGAISRCLETLAPKHESVKGPLVDLWDRGLPTGLSVSLFWVLVGIPLAVGLLGAGILAFLRQWVSAALFGGTCGFLALLVVALRILTWDVEWIWLDVDLSFVLAAAVTLLAVEWLTRKLLRLA